MARSMNLMLGGKDYELVANWKASMAIAETVMDPLVMARDAALAVHFAEHNIPYEPKFEFTVGNTVQILHCALRANGFDLTLDDVGDAVVSDGITKHLGKADDYIALIVSNGSDELEGGKATSGKS